MATKRKAIVTASGATGATAKRGKVAKTTTPKSGLLNETEIIQLSEEITKSNKNYNNFVKLLQQYEYIKSGFISGSHIDSSDLIGRKLSIILFTNFEKLMKDQSLTIKRNDDETKKTVCKWLQSKYEQFKDTILEFIVTDFHYKSSLQVDLLEIYLNFIKLESEFMKSNTNDLYFPNVTYKKLVDALLTSENGVVLPDGTTDNFLVLEFIETFTENWDLEFYFINQLHETLADWKETKTNEQLQLIFANFTTIIRNKVLFTDSDLSELNTWTGTSPALSIKHSNFKTQFQKTIITILSYPLLSSQYRSILLVLHKRVIPYMAQPHHLMDFLTDSYNVGGVVSILSLNSLFELMKNYNLEYPDFFDKLYSLFNQELLHTRYKSRFFRLVDIFLGSTHLPANIVASFIKRMARLTLTSGASGVVIVIPFIYNLMKKHPSCMIMLHNTETITEYTDPFDNEQTDPSKTKAMGSSLWELETLMSHYHPNIATLAKIFGEPFRKHSYNMEDFLDWSYVTLLDSESSRKYKKEAALEYEQWDNLLSVEAKSAYADGWTW